MIYLQRKINKILLKIKSDSLSYIQYRKTMEKLILKYLAKGKTQAEISAILKKKGIEPHSLSFIEKTLKDIRKKYNVKTMFQLGLIISKIKNQQL